MSLMGFVQELAEQAGVSQGREQQRYSSDISDQGYSTQYETKILQVLQR